MTTGLDESDGGATPLDDAVIGRSLHCMRCGYDLRGLRIAGRCPECGLEAWDSVHRVVDPAARGLPELRDPRGVGNAIVWVMLCLFVSTLLLLARPVALRIHFLSPGGATDLLARTPPTLSLYAGFILLLGLVSIVILAPPRGGESSRTIRRDLWLLGGGLVATGMLAIALWQQGLASATRTSGSGGINEFEFQRSLIHLLMLMTAVAILFGLRGVLRVIGERSREYRTARGGRQRIRDMIAAAVAVAIGETLQGLGALVDSESLFAIGGVMKAVIMLMLVIGLLYLLVNTIWIRRSLRRPPPSWRDVLIVPGDAGRDPPDDEDGEAPDPDKP